MAARRARGLVAAAALAAAAAHAEPPSPELGGRLESRPTRSEPEASEVRAPAELGAAAGRLVADLPPDAQSALRFPFDDAERREIRFAPFLLDGLRVGDLSPEQNRLVDALLAASLSRTGFEKVRRIRDLEDALLRKEERLRFGWLRSWMRDRGRYFLALFGDPGGGEPWSYRFEGHHLSLHLTVVPGAVSASTPLFLGAEPRIVPAGDPGAGRQVLRAEEELARSLYRSLGPTQRAKATLAYESERALMRSAKRTPDRPDPVGLARAEMDAAQRAALDALLDVYVDNFAQRIAEERRAEIDAAGRAAIRFAWAEADDPANAFYYRIQGPTFLIELDNTTDGDHLHAVWRDFRGDWGEDLLAAHHERAH